MGNNAAFTTFEATVLATYNKGVLDQDLLAILMEQYRDTDIDHGGMTGALSKDGLDVEEIVLKVFTGSVPPRPKLSAEHKTWSPEQEMENGAYWDQRYEAFKKISERFGWC